MGIFLQVLMVTGMRRKNDTVDPPPVPTNAAEFHDADVGSAASTTDI